ncbi:MAG: bifunctional phosphoglucose/phosphomannose isomerase [Chloroflexi bacterium]|nr:MAG: bifunctional phosphoglucose/phosphomannose isomerase [Chloroflexota bacterium]
MTINLDDLQALRANDPAGMLDRIHELPAQVRDAWDAIQTFQPPRREIRHVVVAGMGGSAIGGSLVQALAEPECPVPISVNRDYHLPAYVGKDTLVIASSYSGNTEETLSALDEALTSGAITVGVTTDGRLAEIARERGFQHVLFNYDAPPRAAVGHSFTLLLGLLVRFGLLADKADEVAEAVDVMLRLQRVLGPQVPAARNPAKDLARRLAGKVPTIYGAGLLAPVARRWKGQFNENAKTWAAFDEMPELNHNTVLGYGHPSHLTETAFVIMLRSSLEDPQIATRFDITAELLERAGIDHAVVTAWGESPTAQMLSALHYGDYVSYYLAALNQEDPTPIPAIDYLKRRLQVEGG